MILPQGTEKLISVQSQLNFLYECFSQPNGFLELSEAGEGGLCTLVGSLADQVEEVTEELMAEEKNKKKVKIK